MFDKCLKIMGLESSYTKEDLDEAYRNKVNKIGELNIINSAYLYLKRDLENKLSLDKKTKRKNHSKNLY